MAAPAQLRQLDTPARAWRRSMAVVLLTVLGSATPALAQPEGGEGEAEPDRQKEIDEAVAIALFDRGQLLFAQRDYINAKVMFIESLERSSSSAAAEKSLAMLRSTNERLGVKNLEHGAPALGQLPSANEPLDPYAEDGAGSGDGEAPVDPYDGAGSEAPVDPYAVDPSGGGGAGSGGASASKVDRDVGWSARDSRNWSMLSGGAWGAYTVALLGDVVSDNSSGGEIAGYALAGGLIGAGVGYLYGTKLAPSAADLSLINSLTAYGTAAGLFLGVAIDPPKNEAYTLQGALGSMVGIGAGHYLAKRVEISPRRMMWIDVGAASGAVASWVLFYPLISDSASNDDEQTTGLITIAAMGAGAYLAYRFTRKMDAGKPAAEPAEPPLVGLLQRSSRGEWGVGVPLLRPMDNPALAPRSAGLSLGVDVLGGRF